MDQRRRLHGLALRGGLDRRPLLLEQLQVALELLALGAAGRGADDQPAAALRLQLLDEVAQPVALAVGQPLRDAVALAVRRVDQEPAGQRHVHRDARALRPHRVLHDLDEQALTVLDQLLDLLLAPLPVVELGEHDLVDVEEAVLGQAGVDERRLHAREDVVHPAEVHVAEQRAARGALEIGLDDDVVLDDRDPRLIRVGGDQDLLHAVSPGAPTGLLPRSARSSSLVTPVTGRAAPASSASARATSSGRAEPSGAIATSTSKPPSTTSTTGANAFGSTIFDTLRRGALDGRRLRLRIARGRALHHRGRRVELDAVARGYRARRADERPGREHLEAARQGRREPRSRPRRGRAPRRARPSSARPATRRRRPAPSRAR